MPINLKSIDESVSRIPVMGISEWMCYYANYDIDIPADETKVIDECIDVHLAVGIDQMVWNCGRSVVSYWSDLPNVTHMCEQNDLVGGNGFLPFCGDGPTPAGVDVVAEPAPMCGVGSRAVDSGRHDLYFVKLRGIAQQEAARQSDLSGGLIGAFFLARRACLRLLDAGENPIEGFFSLVDSRPIEHQPGKGAKVGGGHKHGKG